MVFMTMGDDYTSDFAFALGNVAEIWNYQVDAEHFFLGEH